jgi:hypothetical protein
LWLELKCQIFFPFVQSDIDCGDGNDDFKQDKASCATASDQFESDNELLSTLHESCATDDHEMSAEDEQEWESMGESSEEVENFSEDDCDIHDDEVTERESKNNIRFVSLSHWIF